MSERNIVHRLEHVRAATCDLQRVHRSAMAAKECTFTAQDALSRVWSEGEPGPKRRALLKKLERRLARVRAELEQLDNDCLLFEGGRYAQ